MFTFDEQEEGFERRSDALRTYGEQSREAVASPSVRKHTRGEAESFLPSNKEK